MGNYLPKTNILGKNRRIFGANGVRKTNTLKINRAPCPDIVRALLAP